VLWSRKGSPEGLAKSSALRLLLSSGTKRHLRQTPCGKTASLPRHLDEGTFNISLLYFDNSSHSPCCFWQRWRWPRCRQPGWRKESHMAGFDPLETTRWRLHYHHLSSKPLWNHQPVTLNGGWVNGHSILGINIRNSQLFRSPEASAWIAFEMVSTHWRIRLHHVVLDQTSAKQPVRSVSAPYIQRAKTWRSKFNRDHKRPHGFVFSLVHTQSSI